MDPWYTTRERVKDALGGSDVGANNTRIDRNIDASSRAIEQRLHRVFWPKHATKYFTWPDAFAAVHRVWIDHPDQLIDLEVLTAGGIELDLFDVFPEPANEGPPYDRIELNRGSRTAFSVGSTEQRDIAAVGLWGYRNDETTVTDVVSESGDVLEVTEASGIGVGSLLRVNGERMLVDGRLNAATGRALASQLNDTASATVLTMDGTAGAPVPGEPILVDGEYMTVIDVNGTALLVRRAQQSSVLATHLVGAAIAAPRRLMVRRAVGGTEQGTHNPGDAVFRWDPPSIVERLCIGETIAMLRSETAGMAPTVGTGESASELTEAGLKRLWRDAYNAIGRKARIRGVSGR